MKKTIVVQIGNSDNKLVQEDWNNFYRNIDSLVSTYGDIHFSGGPANVMPWQNWCWVIEIDEEQIIGFKMKLQTCRARFDQESVAVLIGDVDFV